MASDPYIIEIGILKDLLLSRAESHVSGSAYVFFVDWIGSAQTIDELFGGVLSRKELYATLQKLTQSEHQFKDWLPPKVKLAWAASFERDTRMRYYSRVKTFSGASIRDELKSKMSGELLDAVEDIADSQ